MNIPITFDEQYQHYLGLYAAFRKPLNDRDMKYGHSAWIPMSIEDRRAAYIDLRKRFIEAADVKFVPHPQKHLFERAWERRPIQTAHAEPRIENIACQDCLDCGFRGSDVYTSCECTAGARWREEWGLEKA